MDSMKQLQCNFTTPEQSKRLLELGLPADSADCFHPTNYQKKPIEYATPIIITYQLDTDEIEWDKVFAFPCWSVGRLMEIIDICANEDSSDDCSEEYPSTTKVMRKLNMDYITYLVKSIERATELKIIDFSKL